MSTSLSIASDGSSAWDDENDSDITVIPDSRIVGRGKLTAHGVLPDATAANAITGAKVLSSQTVDGTTVRTDDNGAWTPTPQRAAHRRYQAITPETTTTSAAPRTRAPSRSNYRVLIAHVNSTGPHSPPVYPTGTIRLARRNTWTTMPASPPAARGRPSQHTATDRYGTGIGD